MSDKRVAKTGSWLWILLRGIIAILFGLYSLLMPAQVSVFTLQFIAIYILIDAIILLFYLVMDKEVKSPKWALWIRVIFGLWLGIYIVFIHPIAGTLVLGLTLITILAIQAIVIGVIEVITSVFVKEVGFMGIIFGIIWIIFGVMLFVSPVQSIMSLVFVNGFFALSLGISLVFYSFKYRKTVA